MSQSAFSSNTLCVVKYSDRKLRACQKLGNSPVVGKCTAPNKAGKCPAVAGGGGGVWLGAGGID